MGRGRRQKNVAPRTLAEVRLGSRSPRAFAPEWGDDAALRYRETYSARVVREELKERLGARISVERLRRYLEDRGDVAMRKESTRLPFTHDGISPSMTAERWQRLEAEVARREGEGEIDEEIADFVEDELARYSRVEHLCYTNEELFNGRDAVAAIIRRLKKWHRTVGRPVAGEAFEDLLAGAWADLGIKVLLAPRNYDGADAHVLQNSWVAMSMKSEARAKPSQRTIQLASLAPHNVELNSPEDCRRAIWQAVAHLGRYERLIYLRGSDDHFPGGDQRAQRYTLFELPKREISGRLYDVREDDFAPFFEDADEARTRNSFSVPVFGDDGRKLFSVTLSRRPPRVAITSIDLADCGLIASYWTEPLNPLERISRRDAAAGVYDRYRQARWDMVEGKAVFWHDGEDVGGG